MPIGFPPSPTIGQQYPVVDPLWEWNGTVWESLSGTPIINRYTSLVATDDAIFLRGNVPGLVSASVMSDAFGGGVAATEPAALTNLQWDAQPTAVPGEMEYQVDELPSDGGSAITALEYRVGAGAAIALTGTGIGNRTVTSGWTAGTAADTQIRAVNAIGPGAWSDAKTRTVLAPVPVAPSALTVGQWTSTPGDGQIVFDIIDLPYDGGSPITALEYTLNGSTWTAFAGTGTGPRTVTGLTNATSYPAQVRAVNAIGNGAASDTKNTTPAAGGGAVLVQRAPISRVEYAPAAAVFPSPVTPGNTIIIYGVSTDGGAPSATTNQSDTVVANTQAVGNRTLVLSRIASAVGGATTVTLNGGDVHSVYAEEWAGISYNTAAGVGSASGAQPLTVTTPGASDVADAVSFSVWTSWAGGDYSAQAVATGFTEGDRYTGGPGFAAYSQLIGGYRVETATGAKSATWPDPGIFPDTVASIIMVFGVD
jgi:hypothetical protein